VGQCDLAAQMSRLLSKPRGDDKTNGSGTTVSDDYPSLSGLQKKSEEIKRVEQNEESPKEMKLRVIGRLREGNVSERSVKERASAWTMGMSEGLRRTARGPWRDIGSLGDGKRHWGCPKSEGGGGTGNLTA